MATPIIHTLHTVHTFTYTHTYIMTLLPCTLIVSAAYADNQLQQQLHEVGTNIPYILTRNII